MSGPELSTEERATVEQLEAALQRVLALADFHAECCEYVKVRDLRAAVEGPQC